MSWSRWNWLDDGALPLAIAILRVCWLWPWLALLQRWLASSYRGTLLPIGLVLGLLLGGMITARRALTLSLSRRSAPPSLRDAAQDATQTRARIAVAGIGLAVIFAVLWWQLYQAQYPWWNVRWVGAWGTEMMDWSAWESRGVPPPFFALLAMAYLWLRGVLDGGRPFLTRDDVWRTFVTGFIALAVLLMVATLDEGASLNRGHLTSAGNLLWLFFTTGMAALALADFKMVRGLEKASGPEGHNVQLRLDRYWLGSVVSVIVVLLGLGLALSALIAPEAVAQALGAAWIVLRQGLIYLWIIISLLLYPIAYLLALALRPLLDRLREFRGLELPSPPELPDALRPEDRPGGVTDIIDRMPEELRWVALAVLIVLIGLAFALAVRRLLAGSRIKDGIEETRELIFARDLLQEQWSRLWRSWLSRLRRSPQTAFSPFLSLEGEPYTRRAIRAIYQALLAAAKERGQPRSWGQTPLEYRRELEREWLAGRSGDIGALDAITKGYVQARYAPDPPTAEQVRHVRQAWEQLQASLEAQKEKSNYVGR